MARTGVTLDDVIDAIARLSIKGQKPTVASIREFLGTGSHSTIAAHLKTWRNKPQSLNHSDLASNIPKTLIPLIDAFWEQALLTAQLEFKEKEQTLQQTNQTLQLMADEFETELNNVLNENEQLENKLQSIKIDYQNLQKELQQLKAFVNQQTAHENIKNQKSQY